MLRSPACVLCLVALCTVMRVAEGNQCLTELEEVNPKRVVHDEGRSLNIRFELSNRITQRLVSKIMKIFLVEVLGYPGVELVEIDDQFDHFEVFKRLSQSPDSRDMVTGVMVNMEVWIPGQMDTTLYLEEYHVKDCGSVGPAGYFGWFVPQELWRSNMTETWRIFSRRESSAQFDVDQAVLAMVKSKTLRPGSTSRHYCSYRFCHEGIYTPKQCANSTPCAMLLASDPNVTKFVVKNIEEKKLFVRVAWVGPALRNLTLAISQIYSTTNSSKSLVILHQTPSEVVPNDRDFVSIVFPRCRNSDGQCKYDDNKLVKMVWARLESIATVAYTAIKKASFTADMYEDLIRRYNDRKPDNTEDSIACEWLRENLNSTLKKWKPRGNDKKVLHLGGIFPMTGDSYKARSTLVAARMANDAINKNNTVLRDYRLKLSASDGQCKVDMVMKAFIDYIINNSQREPLIGILGPACSETVEPLVGVSKQYSTMVISYSAEGSSFDDREKYPYFFRTIGENIHYKYVYLGLLERMNWQRVAALTEDGQKYTEYISHMQYYLEENKITFVDNAKYPREREGDLMIRNLENLKKKRARIIIADVEDEVARQVMCDAYKLEMTAYQGYVWFLPLWLLPGWWDTEYHNRENGESVSCTTSEMSRAVNGYLAISHAFFASDDSVMQENITVREWRDRYEANCKAQNQTPSDYAGFVYDAAWTYAYAMDRLISENESYVLALQTPSTADRLTQIISGTDFPGVSGRIKFLSGASRISLVEIVQYVDNEVKKVGIFHPNVSESNEVVGGHLELNVSAILWLTADGKIPNDGSEPEVKCVLASLADLLDVTCEVAIVVVNIIVFGLLGILLIVGFVVVKRKYDEKVRLHEKYMKSLGIDLLQTDTSGLDKWEIPRECVVINRKLGEGAFGTVYGGEAFFAEKGWLAVAVKTLKVGSSTEEKLDFLSEVEVMKRFEHKNIIKLLGVCIKCEPVYTVMEFMLYGDLKTYLLARRHLVNDRNYEDYDEISSKKLTAMALDVARALSYLAQLKYVHRDIASRNCLVNAQRVVKVGDFGMTRPMYENDYYKFNRKGMLPVRWMAPESLGLGIFTPASDVWSYGVLLYEIITFGSFPFQGLSNNEVLEHVKSGNTITIPSGIKGPLENLIRSCWTIDYKSRPNAPEIVDFLATNPRLLSPCLDVPLASVQPEHTGQIEMQLPEKFRKFSVSLAKSNQPSSKISSIHSPCDIPLMGIGEAGCNCEDPSFITAKLYESGPSATESSRPLLADSADGAKSKYVKLQRSVNRGAGNDAELLARYVNMQPGRDIGDSSTDRRILVDDLHQSASNGDEEELGNEANRMSFL